MNSFFEKTNMWFATAAAISFASVGLHVIGGTPEIMVPLEQSNAPQLSKGIADVIWQQVTFLLVVGGIVFAWASRAKSKTFEISITMIVLYAGITLIFIGNGISRFAGIADMPQWVLFLAMTVLPVVGLLRSNIAK